ncbi:MAG: hypothetical protein ACI4CY_05065, partial [Candidatus Gastranaerophilaceae bacterium]
ATFGGIKVYNKNFNKLAGSGIKFGEINEVLFNFIKKNDPAGDIYTSKSSILELDKALTEENIPIFKQLARMKENTKERLRFSKKNEPRFDTCELARLIKVTNQDNLKYLTELAEKVEKNKYGDVATLSADKIERIMAQISPKNVDMAETVITRAKIDESEDVIRCLQDINKDNIEAYKLLFNSRNKSGVTDLSFEEIRSLKNYAMEHKNLDLLDTLVNTEKKDGSGAYRFSICKITDFEINPEKVPIFKKLLEIEDLKSTELQDLKQLANVTDENNIEILKGMLSKKYEIESLENEKKYLSDVFTYDTMEDVLKNITPENKSIATRLLDLDGYNINGYKYKYLVESSAKDKTKLDKIKSLLDNPDNKPKINDVYYKVHS